MFCLFCFMFAALTLLSRQSLKKKQRKTFVNQEEKFQGKYIARN